MDALINVVLPVFGIILTGYLAGYYGVLGPTQPPPSAFLFLLCLASSPFYLCGASADRQDFQLAFHRRNRDWFDIDASHRARRRTSLVPA